jgi:hypothetical protein
MEIFIFPLGYFKKEKFSGDIRASKPARNNTR